MPHGGLIKVEGPRILAVRQGVDVAAWGFFKPVPPVLHSSQRMWSPHQKNRWLNGIHYATAAALRAEAHPYPEPLPKAHTLQWKGKNRTSRKAFAEIGMAGDGEGPSAP